MKENSWKTAITNVEPNKISVKGYQIDQLMGNASFAQVVYLILKGELPDENTGKLIDCILVSSIDHGVTPPSTLAAITVASTGAEYTAALSSGILAISDFHGGAIENAMKTFYEINKLIASDGISMNAAVNVVVKDHRKKKIVVSGFGHRYHTEDPRKTKLFEIAKECKLSGNFVEIALLIEKVLHEITNRRLPLNVDGAMGALLCEMDFPVYAGNMFFILSRVSGLSAHIFEEKYRFKPMRKIDPFNWEYDGPPVIIFFSIISRKI